MYTYMYTQRIDCVEGNLRYIVAVSCEKGKTREVFVSKEIYEALDELRLYDRRIEHQIERHNEFSELTDETLYDRAFFKPKPVDEVVLDNLLAEQALEALRTLPFTQKKRFVLRNILGLTYAEIGALEGCCARSVKDSVDLATKKIRRILKL